MVRGVCIHSSMFLVGPDGLNPRVTYMNVLTSEDDPTQKPTSANLMLLLDSLVASRAIVIEDGAPAAKKPDGERRLLLNIEVEGVRVLVE